MLGAVAFTRVLRLLREAWHVGVIEKADVAAVLGRRAEGQEVEFGRY